MLKWLVPAQLVRRVTQIIDELSFRQNEYKDGGMLMMLLGIAGLVGATHPAAQDGSHGRQVTWSATGGAITHDGLYTANGSSGQFRVVASIDGTNVRDTAEVTLLGPPVGHPFSIEELVTFCALSPLVRIKCEWPEGEPSSVYFRELKRPIGFRVPWSDNRRILILVATMVVLTGTYLLVGRIQVLARNSMGERT